MASASPDFEAVSDPSDSHGVKESKLQGPSSGHLVKSSVEVFDNLRSLVSTHHGYLPLETASAKYAEAYGEKLAHSREGMPLEYLVMCLRGLDVQQCIVSDNKTEI